MSRDCWLTDGVMSSLGPDVPPYARAVIEALRFRSPNLGPLLHLNEPEWDRALSFCDHAMLTLSLGARCGEALPSRIRKRVESNLRNNAERWRSTQAAYREVANALDVERIDFALLKGFSHCPHFIRDPRHRPHADIDLLFAPEDVFRARDVARSLGYQPLPGFEDFPIDHLPRMVRRTAWRWRGDFFDVEMPVSLELHFRLWDTETEKVRAEGIEEFWRRREFRTLEEINFPALSGPDALAYSTLHILRHLLRGDLRASHVYELASFLETHAEDDIFWRRWAELHPAALRRLEAISFCMAARWFACALSRTAVEEIERLPSDTTRWLSQSALAPLASLFHPNKEEIWLHWTLLDSTRDRRRVLLRRLLPTHFPRFVPYPQAEDAPSDWGTRARDALKPWLFAAGRLARHVRSLIATARGAMRWFTANTPCAD